ncbi:MAG: hypothetical protein ACAH83_01840 [Alphaproteobacteria bacterium]
MQDPGKSPWFTIAALLVLAGLIISQFILAGREQEIHEAQIQKIAAAEAVEREKQAALQPSVVVEQQRQADPLSVPPPNYNPADPLRAPPPDYSRVDVTYDMPTGAQRIAAEAYYKEYLDPDTSKVVSRQIPQETHGNTLQGFNMNKWLYFSADGMTATLVGMGEAYINIKPEDLYTMNYTYYNQGRLGTMIVVNFRIGDDPLFAPCKNAFERGFPPQKLLSVFGFGVAERVMHDGLNDEVILNLSPLIQCSLGNNYQ